MTPKFTLVPSELFSEDSAREILSEVVLLEKGEPLSFLGLKAYDAVLVYAGESRPAVYDMIMSLFKLRDYNKILAAVTDGYLYLVIAQGEKLVYCNSFKAADFTTAEYYIFMVLKQLQINPEVSTLTFMSEIPQGRLAELYHYFKAAEVLQ